MKKFQTKMNKNERRNATLLKEKAEVEKKRKKTR